MSDETREDEPNAPTSERESAYFSLDALKWFVRFATVSYLAILMYHLWDDDEVRLHVLHSIVRILHEIARVIGLWALHFEMEYNNVVDSLH